MFRRRFADVVSRQLDLFEEEYSDVISDADEAEAVYERAGREDSEELFGDYMDVVESGAEALADLRDHYASTLDDEVADEYRESFNRAVLKRFPRFGLEIEDL
jgi:isocitrate dehydrogenase kinase/phosphatase